MKAEPLQAIKGPAYAPEGEVGYESGNGADPATIAVMGVTLVAIAGAAVQAFDARPAPVISAPEGPIKVAVEAEPRPDYTVADSAIYDALNGRDIDAHITVRAPEEEPLDAGALGPDLPLGELPELASTDEHPNFVVQLGAYSSESAARARWTALLKENPALLADARVRIEPAQSGAHGRLYRLRAGAFDRLEDASALCQRLDAAGVACMTAQQ